MHKNVDLMPDSLLGRKTLITGETGSGKTISTFLFLLYLLDYNHYTPEEISVLDFGPPKIRSNGIVFAGTLKDCLLLISSDQKAEGPLRKTIECFQDLNWLTDNQNPYLTPRFSAKNAGEVLTACYQNFKYSSIYIDKFIMNPTKILIINDLGIYLHLGGLNRLKKAINSAKTVLMNAYLGKNLLNDRGSNISSREQKILIALGKTDIIMHYAISKIIPSFMRIYPQISEN